jgi:hypothetical protein
VWFSHFWLEWVFFALLLMHPQILLPPPPTPSDTLFSDCVILLIFISTRVHANLCKKFTPHFESSGGVQRRVCENEVWAAVVRMRYERRRVWAWLAVEVEGEKRSLISRASLSEEEKRHSKRKRKVSRWMSLNWYNFPKRSSL